MTPSNLFPHTFLLLAFAVSVMPEGGRLRHNLSKELGLTHSCVKRVLATCTNSLPQSVHDPEERSCGPRQMESLVGVLKESTQPFLQVFKEWLGTSTVQEKSLREVKSDLQSLKEVVSHSAATIQTINETVTVSLREVQSLEEVIDRSAGAVQSLNETTTLSMNDVKSMNVTMLESFNELEDTRKDERQVLEDLVKKFSLQDSAISELQKSLNNLELKMAEQDNTKKIEDLQRFLTKMNETMSSANKQQDLLPDKVKSLKTHLLTPQNCADLLNHGDNETGVRTVYPFSCGMCKPVSVFCDQANDGGGWTVFQHRDDLPEREDFYQSWNEYQRGFGDIEGEFWLGLDNIHALVNGTPMELRVDLEDFDGEKKWAKYEEFSIEGSAEKYKLHLKGYSGDVGDSLMTRHSGRMFTTKDQDNDNKKGSNCAELRHGGWWYDACTDSNLNGLPHQGKYESDNYEGIHWYRFRGLEYSLKKTSMKIRPKSGK